MTCQPLQASDLLEQRIEAVKVSKADLERIAPGHTVLFAFDRAAGKLKIYHSTESIGEIICKSDKSTTQDADIAQGMVMGLADDCCNGQPYCCEYWEGGKSYCMVC